MNKRERVYAALEGQPVDRVPLSLWRHFHKQDQTPAGLASATLAFYRRYDFDLIKLTPSALYAIEDWGANIVPSKEENQPPHLKKPVIKNPEDWRNLTTLSVSEGSYGRVLEAVKLVTDQLAEEEVPILMTIFSPLTIAYQLAGEALLDHLQNQPTDVQIGLATIAETTSRFANIVLEAGAHGIFFVSHLSRADMLSEEMCQDFVIRYDLIALERVKLHPAPLILHLHGPNLHFDSVNQYPAHAVSWHNHDGGPSLKEALSLTDKTLVTGLNKNFLEAGAPEELAAQVRDAIAQTGGQRLIIAPTGVVPPTTPEENLQSIMNVDRSVNHHNASSA